MWPVIMPAAEQIFRDLVFLKMPQSARNFQMKIRVFVLATLIAVAAVGGEEHPGLTASDIMKRVAENQDREQKARTQFVYEETVHRAMRRKNGKLLREEYRTYTVIPGVKKTEKKLQSVKGRYWKKDKYVDFEGEPVPEGGLFNITADGDENGESHTKDGLDKELFPLTSEEQHKYAFEMSGERLVRGRSTYQIHFQPADSRDYGWTGEALIDREEFQPVSVYTQLSRRLPLGVRAVLGTDVPGLGFSVQYTRVDKDLWFPSTYGTEFGLRALFLLNRTFTESRENKNFRRTSVESQVSFSEKAAPQ